MRTIKGMKYVRVVAKNDYVEVFNTPVPPQGAGYVLDIEIDVPDERDTLLLRAFENIVADDGNCPVCRTTNKWGHTDNCPVRIAIDALAPRPPRTTIREVEKP